jgi:nucleoside phosphorylase
MVGIVFATRREAEPFLARAAALTLADRPLVLFHGTSAHSRPWIAVISGMGKVAAAMAATQLVLVHRVSTLISAGLCGRLTRDRRWAVADLLRISAAVEGDRGRVGAEAPPSACDPRWFQHLEPARLVTCDRPVFKADYRDRMARSGELVDMEGAAVARVADRYGVGWAMIKGISDDADETGRRDLARNIARVSMDIADALVDELSRNPMDEPP